MIKLLPNGFLEFPNGNVVRQDHIQAVGPVKKATGPRSDDNVASWDLWLVGGHVNFYNNVELLEAWRKDLIDILTSEQ